MTAANFTKPETSGLKAAAIAGSGIAPVPRLALRAPEAAEALSVSPSTLAIWTRDGIVPGIRIRGVLLYSVAALQEFLAEQACGVTEAYED